MKEMLQNYLDAALANLEEYKKSGDENAIRAGQGMVDDFKKLLEKL
jgi:hypothetical protein